MFTPLGPFSEAENADCEASLEEINKRCDFYQVTATNFSSRSVEGPIVVTDMLPAGLTVVRSEFVLVTAVPVGENGTQDQELGGCTSENVPVVVTCTFGGTLEPDGALELRLRVTVAPGAESGAPNTVKLAVPGSPEASLSEPMVLSSEPLSFGPSGLVSYIASASGTPDTQAGDHPYEMTTRIDLNSAVRVISPEGLVDTTGVHDLKDVVVDLPVGVVGDAQATAKCTFAQLASAAQGCPADTRVGQLVSEPEGFTVVHNSVYNMVPEHGVAAEFGFNDALRSPHAIYASVVPTPAGYVVRATTREVPQVRLTDVIATFYGDPAAKAGAGSTPVAMFTNPSDCSGKSLTATAHLDSWQEPGVFSDNGTPPGEPDLTGANWVPASSNPEESPPVTGCNRLQFNPSFTLAPTSSQPDSPTGLRVDLKIPQTETPGTLATPPLKDVTVTLPQGLAVSPSSATGLQGCSDAQIGYLGGTPSNFTAGPGSCPPASQIGEVTIHTPVLEEALKGQVFVGTPLCNPCSAADAQSGRMVRLFIQIHSDNSGITIKSPGTVSLDPATGRLVSTFKGLPQQPFSELEFKFKEGPRAPLSTPSTCGEYQTGASLTPWSTPYTPTASSPSRFTISGCGASPFTPAFTGGTVNNQAGQYSPLTVSFSRADPEQDVGALEAVLPPGVLAKLAGVPQCGEAELNAAKANTGECPAASQIGTITVAAGPGPQPFYTTGRIYLTGAYNGGPFGAATIVPAVAGPFNLGNVVVRGSIRINPITAQGSVVTDAFPSMLDGIPLQLRSVNVTVQRPDGAGFAFNSTSCDQALLTATIASTTGTKAGVSSPYQAASCANLPFKPSFTVSTQGATSKLNGASLDVRIATRQGPDVKPGEEEANIHKVDVTLPIALPSRLTTLQKACTEQQFAANPAGCPEGSVVGTAVAHTPLLPVPLEGPAILVSHGGAAFPNLEILLQGDGVLVQLTGNTDIKNGITYSKFESAPDAPFQSFELKLPEGPHSVLAANGNLCAPTKTVTVTKKVTKRVKGHSKKVTVKVKKTVPEALLMPTTMTAQSGTVLTQNTKIAVTGCPTAKAAKKANTARKARKARRAAANATTSRSAGR